MSLMQRSLTEFTSTVWLVLGGCGAAVFAAGVPDLGTGYLGVSFAFGLTVLTMAYAIRLALTLIHLISIPVSNTSVNPARSTGPAHALAILGEGKTLAQLWLFWMTLIFGAALAGVIYRFFECKA